MTVSKADRMKKTFFIHVQLIVTIFIIIGSTTSGSFPTLCSTVSQSRDPSNCFQRGARERASAPLWWGRKKNGSDHHFCRLLAARRLGRPRKWSFLHFSLSFWKFATHSTRCTSGAYDIGKIHKKYFPLPFLREPLMNTVFIVEHWIQEMAPLFLVFKRLFGFPAVIAFRS